MSLDTTYYISSGNNNTATQIIIHGGRDTAIYLAAGQMPSEVDSSLAGDDSTVKALLNIMKGSNGTDNSIVTNYKPDQSYNTDLAPFVFIAIFVFIMVFLAKRSSGSDENEANPWAGNNEDGERVPKKKACLTYYGDEISLTETELTDILNKRFPYYRSLSSEQQAVFIHRLQNFMSKKIFKIYDSRGFKEMPVLISAAAIQLTFGLKKYLLPHFEFIHIYPQEFLRIQPILCFLEGNVSGHTIKLSWKHFLEGFENPENGQNVGLHELAHALYYQTFIVEQNVDKGFRNYYNGYMIDANKAYDSERSKTVNLYSEYAERNLQEFWAESVEIFFEKPVQMQSSYPQLYESMKNLLNQDPVNKIASMSS